MVSQFKQKNMMAGNTRAKIEKKLAKIELELERVRGASPITHGWQTQKLARASRKWDQLCIEKRRLLCLLDECV